MTDEKTLDAIWDAAVKHTQLRIADDLDGASEDRVREIVEQLREESR